MARKELSQDELLRIKSAADLVRERAVQEEAPTVTAAEAPQAVISAEPPVVAAPEPPAPAAARYFLAVTPANAAALREGKPETQATLTFSALRELIVRVTHEHGGDDVTADDDLKNGIYVSAFETADAACNTATGIIFAMDSFNEHDNALGGKLVLRSAVSAPDGPDSDGQPAGPDASNGPDVCISAARSLLEQAGENDLIITTSAFDALEEKGAYDRVEIGGENSVTFYRFNPATAADLARSTESAEPIVDAVTGVSASKLHPNSIIWVNRSGIFTEAVIDKAETLPNSDIRLDLSLPNGNQTRLQIKPTIQLCTTQKRAVEIGIRKYKTLPGIETFDDLKAQREAVNKSAARSGAEIGGFVAVVLAVLGLIYYLVIG